MVFRLTQQHSSTSFQSWSIQLIIKACFFSFLLIDYGRGCWSLVVVSSKLHAQKKNKEHSASKNFYWKDSNRKPNATRFPQFKNVSQKKCNLHTTTSGHQSNLHVWSQISSGLSGRRRGGKSTLTMPKRAPRFFFMFSEYKKYNRRRHRKTRPIRISF